MRILKLERWRLRARALVSVCLINLLLLLQFVPGQVVIVPKKPNKPKTNSKVTPKTKSKTTKSVIRKDVPTPTPTPAPLRLPDPVPEAPAPAPAPVAAPPPEVKPAEPEARVAPPINLSEYMFEVITGDSKGKVTDSRKTRARYFTETLSDGIAIEMVEIPGGSFSMGTASDEIERIAVDYGREIKREFKTMLPDQLRWETPQRRVRMSRFYLSKYEVTQAQWRAVAGLPKVNRDLSPDPSYFKGGFRPVEMVSWEDAVEFCDRLSRATGREYRLPTEAEWEYACRAGSRTAFHFGATMTPAWANYDSKAPYASAPRSDSRKQTTPVGSLGIANAFGLYDMHGNVWEWCLDTWHDNYAMAPDDGRSWEKEANNYVKVIRGGAWNSYAGQCRATSRNRITAPFKLSDIGFRVVAEAKDKTGR